MNIRSLKNFSGLLKQMGIVICVFYWVHQVYPQDMEFDWAKRAGGMAFDTAQDIAVDGSGNVYVTGWFINTAIFGSTTLYSPGNEDIFIAKLSASGDFLWAKQAGGSDDDVGIGIAVDGSGNVYVTGDFHGTATFGSTTLYITSADYYNFFITKLDASGNFLWAKKGGGSDGAYGKEIDIDGSGNIYVTGNFKGTATFGSTTLTNAGYWDVFIAKLNALGEFLWIKQATEYSRANGEGITVDGSGNVYVIGCLGYNATFGSTILTSDDDDDIFIVKLDASGNFLWAKQVVGGKFSLLPHFRIDVDGSGNVYMIGDFFYGTATFGSTTLTSAGYGDVFIAKLNASGNFLWAKQFSASNAEWGRGISVDGSGNVYVTGDFSGTATFGSTTLTSDLSSNIFIGKLNASGNFLWAKQSNGSYGESVYGITVDGSGNVYVTGWFMGTATFGSTTLTSADNIYGDIFIAKLKPVSVMTFPKPTLLVALDGYDQAIPLVWKAPSNVPAGNPVRRYSLYRYNPDNSHTYLQGNGTRTYFRDTTVVNGETYGYRVRAVYDTDESDYSSLVQGHPQDNGYTIQSAAASTPPTVDGVLSSGEWSGAGTADITYPGETGPVTFYAFNDASALYVAVDDTRDNALQTNDTFGLFFDENLNREWPSSVPSGEGLLWLLWNGTSAACAYEGFSGYWPGHVAGEDWTTPSDVTQGISTSSGHVQYEGRIPFSTFLQVDPGSTVGMLLYIYEAQTSSLDGLWPQEVAQELPAYASGNAWAHGPFSYGDLILSSSTTQTRNVTFRVTVPSNTPFSDVIYIMGNFNSWNPAGQAMTKTGTNEWEVTLPFTAGQVLEFKYTRGSLETVEKGSQGEDIANRTITVPGTDCIAMDTVAKWADLTSVESDNTGVVTEFKLCQNYPNPFNPETLIKYQIPEPSQVAITIYDLQGREINTIMSEQKEAGYYSTVWDGRDEQGRIVSNGIYLCRFKAGSYTQTIRMIFMK